MGDPLMHTQPLVVLIDDEPYWIESIRELLAQHGYRLQGFTDPAEGLRFLSGPQAARTLAVLLDVRFGTAELGLEVLQQIVQLPSPPPVFMLSSYERALYIERALKQGAESYIPKEQLSSLPERLRRLTQQRQPERHQPFDFLRQLGIETRSEKMRELARKIQLYAPTDLAVLIHGETGTGKTLVAHALHRASHRHRGPFVAVDIPNVAGAAELFSSRLFGTVKGAYTGAERTEGFFHAAHGGTLFLDEIGELSPEQQAKLLKPVEEKRFCRVGSIREEAVELRIIAATNQDIARMVDDGRFRRDLYERLSQEVIFIPPLRERPDDIVHLAQHFARIMPELLWHAAPQLSPFRFAEAALELLCAQPWKGNVRELRHTVQKCLLLAHEAGTSLITPRIVRQALTSSGALERQAYSTLKQAKQRVTREMLEYALQAYSGNVIRAARALGISREHCHRLIKHYALDVNAFRTRSLRDAH